ncbi:helix-turn-helix domain-containing protein [uncultured Ilyobacter sp.]|uniref:winged helix-turn-helix transcriptional regulator n=1 Tax=uncultured Ilyobacter sp. TaxID=544433 RepID=UPI0029F503D5|nr:helix-turn-helix domain-containing protein [uncultured Ilyobacter sp.]
MGNKDVLNDCSNGAICHMAYTMNRIAEKWKLVILWHIYNKEVIRYGELRKSVGKITHKMLSNQLKELVSDGIIYKKIYHQVPPKVRYSLAGYGKTLAPIMDMLYEWGKKNRKD